MATLIPWTDDQGDEPLPRGSIGAHDMIPSALIAFAIAAFPAVLVLAGLLIVGVIVASIADAEPGGLVPLAQPGN
jgi:hypothetical protein